MFVKVKAYYNRDRRYTPTSKLEIVGQVTVELADAKVEDICAEVFGLLNDRQISTARQASLSRIALRYWRERLRSMRPGDVITVWTAVRVDDCAPENRYEVTQDGFRCVNPSSTVV